MIELRLRRVSYLTRPLKRFFKSCRSDRVRKGSYVSTYSVLKILCQPLVRVGAWIWAGRDEKGVEVSASSALGSMAMLGSSAWCSVEVSANSP
nr:hypothetical protein Iba_chr01dCG2010 [Ipomoea batatas]